MWYTFIHIYISKKNLKNWNLHEYIVKYLGKTHADYRLT
jgi:hypothetical protein